MPILHMLPQPHITWHPLGAVTAGQIANSLVDLVDERLIRLRCCNMCGATQAYTQAYTTSSYRRIITLTCTAKTLPHVGLPVNSTVMHCLRYIAACTHTMMMVLACVSLLQEVGKLPVIWFWLTSRVSSCSTVRFQYVSIALVQAYIASLSFCTQRQQLQAQCRHGA